MILRRRKITHLLGKAPRQLAKKEYAEKLIEASQLLSLAYRSAGLLRALRATCIFATASIAIEGEADSQIDVAIVPTIELMAWVALELRYLPDSPEAIKLLNGRLKALPLSSRPKSRKVEQSGNAVLLSASTDGT